MSRERFLDRVWRFLGFRIIREDRYWVMMEERGDYEKSCAYHVRVKEELDALKRATEPRRFALDWTRPQAGYFIGIQINAEGMGDVPCFLMWRAAEGSPLEPHCKFQRRAAVCRRDMKLPVVLVPGFMMEKPGDLCLIAESDVVGVADLRESSAN